MIHTIKSKQKMARMRDEARKHWIARKAAPIWKSVNCNINGERLLESWLSGK